MRHRPTESVTNYHQLQRFIPPQKKIFWIRMENSDWSAQLSDQFESWLIPRAAILRVIISAITASRVRSSLVSSPICLPKLSIMWPILLVNIYMLLVIWSAYLRACWPSLQQIIDSSPVGKEAYPLKITLVFALAFAVASKRKFSPSTGANVGRRFENKTR